MLTCRKAIILALHFLAVRAWSFVDKKYLREDVLLEWTYDSSEITMRLTCPTKSWIGIGFSPQGTMAGADIIIAGIKDGKGYILDTYATKSGPPIVDEYQNVDGLEFTQIGIKTSVVFKRKLKSADPDDRNIKEGKMTLIWAYGFLFEIYSNPTYLNYHLSNRGVADVELIPKYSIGTYSSKKYSTHLGLNVKLKWYYSYEYITFEFSAPSMGWIGFGFSPGETMAGADMIIGGYDDFKRREYLFDTHALRNGVPNVREQKNVELLKVEKKFLRTTIKVQRKLNTGDDKDMEIREGEMNIIWAYGTLDIYSKPNLLNYHSLNRGSRKVRLIKKDYSTGGGETATTQTQKKTTIPISIPTPIPTTVQSTTSISKSGFSNLDDEGRVKLWWSIINGKIIFSVVAPTTGWIGLGFNSAPSMAGADFIMGYVRAETIGIILDAHANRNGPPIVDDSQDATILESFQSDDEMRITFERDLFTTDTNDKSIRPEEIYVLWAYGSNDFGDVPVDKDYHGSNRGYKKMNLFER